MSSAMLIIIPNSLQRQAIDEESRPAILGSTKKSTAEERDGSNCHPNVQGQVPFEGASEEAIEHHY